MKTEEKKYNWSNYRKKRLYFIIALLATFPFMILLGNLEKQMSFFLIGIIWFSWAIFFIGPIAFKFGCCPCPKCSKPVHFKNGFGNIFGQNCLNCNIKIGSPD